MKISQTWTVFTTDLPNLSNSSWNMLFLSHAFQECCVLQWFWHPEKHQLFIVEHGVFEKCQIYHCNSKCFWNVGQFSFVRQSLFDCSKTIVFVLENLRMSSNVLYFIMRKWRRSNENYGFFKFRWITNCKTQCFWKVGSPICNRLRF